MKTFSAENLSYWVSLKYCVFWKNAEVFYQTNIFQDVLSKSSLLINFVQLQVPGLRFVLIGHEFASYVIIRLKLLTKKSFPSTMTNG